MQLSCTLQNTFAPHFQVHQVTWSRLPGAGRPGRLSKLLCFGWLITVWMPLTGPRILVFLDLLGYSIMGPFWTCRQRVERRPLLCRGTGGCRTVLQMESEASHDLHLETWSRVCQTDVALLVSLVTVYSVYCLFIYLVCCVNCCCARGWTSPGWWLQTFTCLLCLVYKYCSVLHLVNGCSRCQ